MDERSEILPLPGSNQAPSLGSALQNADKSVSHFSNVSPLRHPMGEDSETQNSTLDTLKMKQFGLR